MSAKAFARRLGGEVALDICPGCKLIWFDQYESAQLAPGGLIELFKLISAHQGDAFHPDADRLNCPRCHSPLSLTHDVQRSTRFTYYRCDSGHGRLTAFFQFLREKNFVRTLSIAEVAKLKIEIKQVRCSGCGAPIDLETDNACRFCKAPISILDANAMQAALQGLAAAETRQHSIHAGLSGVEGMIAALESAQRARPIAQLDAMKWTGRDVSSAPDLIGVGVGLLADLIPN